MKKKITLLGLMMLLLTPVALLAGEKSELPEGQVQTTVEVSGMTCGGCCVKVETAVNKLEGVVAAKADYEKGKAMVTYMEDKVSVEKIVETINTETSFKASMPEKTR